MEIIIMGKGQLKDVNKSLQPFKIIGRVIPIFDGISFKLKEELFELQETKTYQLEINDYNEYIDNKEKTIFMCYQYDKFIGQIILKMSWNNYCYIEDISVDSAYRGQGIGKKLIDQAVMWAKKMNLKGISLETQSNNVLACRFYQKCGFILGGIDKYLYKNFGSDEVALYWYLHF